MTYSKIVSNEVFGESLSNHVVLKSLGELDEYLEAAKRVCNERENVPINPVLQDVFGDVVCGLLQEMQERGSDYGFMNMYSCSTIGMLDIVKAHVQMRQIEEDDRDDLLDENRDVL